MQRPYTIMGGIRDLLAAGLWPLAALVFFASITIPLLKLVTLGYMLVQTQTGSTKHLIGRTRAFRVIEFIGRWSMIDVFVLSILVALVRFGQFANFVAQIGAPCFAAVVVLTMFAVEAFDPRLMWDACGSPRPGHQANSTASGGAGMSDPGERSPATPPAAPGPPAPATVFRRLAHPDPGGGHCHLSRLQDPDGTRAAPHADIRHCRRAHARPDASAIQSRRPWDRGEHCARP